MSLKNAITFSFRNKSSRRNEDRTLYYHGNFVSLDNLLYKPNEIVKTFLTSPKNKRNWQTRKVGIYFCSWLRRRGGKEDTTKTHKDYEKLLIEIHSEERKKGMKFAEILQSKETRTTMLMRKIIYELDEKIIKKMNVNILIGALLNSDYTAWYHYITSKNGFKRFIYHEKWSRYEQDYLTMLEIIMPENNERVVNALLMFCNENQLWKLEQLCINYFFVAMEAGCQVHLLLKTTLQHITLMAYMNNKNTLAVIRILYHILKVYRWKKFDDQMENAFFRLLDLYYNSCSRNNKSIGYLLRQHRGLEICIRNIIFNLTNDDLMATLRYMLNWIINRQVTSKLMEEISDIMEMSASYHQTIHFNKDFGSDLFVILLGLISENSPNKSLLATRILNCVLDRHNQRQQFDKPKIFYQNSPYDIRINEDEKVDRDFFIPYHERFHNSLLEGLLNVANHRDNLIMLFQTLCILIVEVPCSWMTSFIIWLLMDVQTSLVHYQMPHTSPSNHLNAIIISVMTLMCWVHSKEYFTNYITQIMYRRAAFAPHLNPPLRRDYMYADHHVRYFRQDLFVEESEIRLCLLKCFNIKERLELRVLEPPNWEHEVDTNAIHELEDFRNKANDTNGEANTIIDQVHKILKKEKTPSLK